MKVYISGISGVGMGPLALVAKAAGFEVVGSDRAEGLILPELKKAGIAFKIGPQDGTFLKQQLTEGTIDWFVHTSALTEKNPELIAAKEAGIKTSKRDEFISYLVKELGLKMVAVAGTHGKTTTASMLVWLAQSLGLPAAHLVGTTLGFTAAGSFEQGDQFFIYEADEYDRNFLHYEPWLSLIPFVSYDHPDIYPTEEDYLAAFKQFESQSREVLHGMDLEIDPRLSLVGEVRKKDATLAMMAIEKMCKEVGVEYDEAQVVRILNAFPGVGRRFERLVPGVYTDYAHHPEEVAAAMEIAQEEAKLRGLTGIVVVYQPLQNLRQYEVRDGYKNVFKGAKELYWLPTYLIREEDNPLPVIPPEEFIADLDLEPGVAKAAEMGDELGEKLCILRDNGNLILLLAGGAADYWLRDEVKNWD